MIYSERIPSGIVVATLRLEKQLGYNRWQIVDLSRHELSEESVQFREITWIKTESSFFQAGTPKLTDVFRDRYQIQDFIKNWIDFKSANNYYIVDLQGSWLINEN